MKNRFEIVGHTAFILLEHKGETRRTLIDREDLARVMAIPGSWYAMDVGGKRGEKIYVGTIIGGVTIYLHKMIRRSTQPGMVVDHINHGPLDNRKENLRLVTLAQNGQNREGPRKGNKSGYRNVHEKGRGRWVVTLMKEGISYRIGTYSDVHVAGRIAEKAREYYFEQDGYGKWVPDIGGVVQMDNNIVKYPWTRREDYWRVVKGNIEFTIESRDTFHVISAWTIDFRLFEGIDVNVNSEEEMFEEANKFVSSFIAKREGGK